MASNECCSSEIQQQRPSSLRDLWRDFNAPQEITDRVLLKISNELWESPCGSYYTTIEGIICGTKIKASFDISAYDVIIEVAEENYDEASKIVNSVYNSIPDITVCTRI